MKKICVGHSYEGEILKDYEEAKACNFCTHFIGYGLHACAGKCLKKNKEISGGYLGNYSTTAKECDSFECRPNILREV